MIRLLSCLLSASVILSSAGVPALLSFQVTCRKQSRQQDAMASEKQVLFRSTDHFVRTGDEIMTDGKVFDIVSSYSVNGSKVIVAVCDDEEGLLNACIGAWTKQQHNDPSQKASSSKQEIKYLAGQLFSLQPPLGANSKVTKNPARLYADPPMADFSPPPKA